MPVEQKFLPNVERWSGGDVQNAADDELDLLKDSHISQEGWRAMSPGDQECQWQVKPWNREPSVSFEGSVTPGKSKTHVRIRFWDEARIKLTEETVDVECNEYSLE